MIDTNILKRFAITTGVALFLAGFATAGDKCLVIDDKCPVECCKENPGWCDIFDKSTLYKNENACIIQKVALAGRYHGQYLNTDLDIAGQNYQAEYWEHRRFRLGAKVQFLNDFTFFNNWNIAENEALTRYRFFDTVDEMYVKWDPSCGPLSDIGFWVTVGKQKQKITREYSTSSKKILTIERSHMVNEVADNKPWGVSFGFKALGLKHTFGAYSQSVTQNHAWYDTGYGSALYKAEYDLNDNTSLHFDYVFSNRDNAGNEQADDDASWGSDYTHVFALGTESEWDLGHCDRKVGLITDVIVGRERDDQGAPELPLNTDLGGNIPFGEDTFGFVILPYYDLTERLQLVGKYSYASVSRLQRPMRQSNDFRTDGNGDVIQGIPRVNMEDVHTAYIGLNYYICDHNMKIMGGYEHLSADLYGNSGAGAPGVNGGTWMLGVRTYW